MIEMLVPDYTVAFMCNLLGCARSSYYHRAEQPDETELKAAIEAVVTEWPTYGYRRVTAQLRRQEWTVNRKRVQRLMREMGLQTRIKRKTHRTTNSEHGFPRYPNLVQDLEIVRPDQVWVSDTLAPALQVQVSPTSGCGGSSCTWQSSWMSSPAVSEAGIWDAAWTSR